MSQTRDQKRFTISEVQAVDWQELTIQQRTMRPSTERTFTYIFFIIRCFIGMHTYVYVTNYC